MTKRKLIKNLSAAAINTIPRDIDWQEANWEFWEASECEDCGDLVVSSYACNDSHADLDYETECEGGCFNHEGPMMNYWYPALVEDTHEAAKAIAYLPLCVVEINGETGLALTGGGQDLSWEICEAFMLLGHLPPTYFASLPSVCGRGESEKDRWIIAGCKTAFRVKVRQAQWALRNLLERFC